jgi:hypothetical protein
MAISNATSLNDLVGQIVSSEAQSAAYGARVMRQLVHAVQVPQGAGSIVVPRFQALTVAALTEGTAPSSTTWSSDGVTLTPVERGVYVEVSKRVLYADPFADLSPYGEQMGRALAQDEDELILAEVSGFASQFASGVFESAAKETIADAVAILEASGCPGPYFGVFHPTAWAYVRQDLADAGAWANVGKQTVEGFGEGLTNMNGYVGSPYGIPCFISTKVANTGAAGIGYWCNGIFGREALGYGFMQDIKIDVDDNKVGRKFDLMGWYAGDAATLVTNYGVGIRTARV